MLEAIGPFLDSVFDLHSLLFDQILFHVYNILKAYT